MGVPSTIFGLVLFLCFVTPGLLFELLRERSRPARQYSAVREPIVVIAASVMFTLPAALILLTLDSFLPSHYPSFGQKWLPDFEALAKQPGAYSSSHLAQVIAAIVALLVIAGLLALVTHGIICVIQPTSARQRPNPIWHDLIIGTDRPSKAKAVIVAVELKSGATVLGALMSQEPKPDKTMAWLVLTTHPQQEIQVRDANGTVRPLGPGWQYLFISGDDIRTVNVAFI
jgi:Family of unknown function (DUF6338)